MHMTYKYQVLELTYDRLRSMRSYTLRYVAIIPFDCASGGVTVLEYNFFAGRSKWNNEVIATLFDHSNTQLEHTCAGVVIHSIQERHYNHIQGVYDQNPAESIS